MTRAEMDLGLYIAASGMVAEQARQSQLAADLANASTPGFKPAESVQSSFGEVLLSNTTSAQPIGSMSMGVRSGRAVVDLAPAAVHETGRPLDFAVQGEGFFAVRTPQGVRYTRDGRFSASASGVLTDSSGNPVLGQGGTPVKVGAAARVSPSALGLYKLTGVRELGEGLLTGTPAGRASGSIRQGALEESGIDPVQAMVDMTAGLHAYQSAQQVIQTIDQSLQTASTQVGTTKGN